MEEDAFLILALPLDQQTAFFSDGGCAERIARSISEVLEESEIESDVDRCINLMSLLLRRVYIDSKVSFPISVSACLQSLLRSIAETGFDEDNKVMSFFVRLLLCNIPASIRQSLARSLAAHDVVPSKGLLQLQKGSDILYLWNKEIIQKSGEPAELKSTRGKSSSCYTSCYRF